MSNKGIAQASHRPKMNYQDLQWQESGACRDILNADVFFPKKGAPKASRAAKQICQQCPVTGICLEYAMAVGERDGVWGGMSAPERDKLRRQRRKKRSA